MAGTIKNVDVLCKGLTPALFHRYTDKDQSGQEVLPEERLYLGPNNSVGFPASNIIGFLKADKSSSCVRVFVQDTRQWKTYGYAIRGSVMVSPSFIPFLGKDDKPLVFDGFKGQFAVQQDTCSPNPKVHMNVLRPRLDLPWSLAFKLRILEGSGDKGAVVTEALMKEWFTLGGMMVGIAAYHPEFGRFEIARWDVSDG